MTPEERLAALTPEERRRIGTAMRFLKDLKGLYVEGLELGTDMLEGKVRPDDVAVRLVDFERSMRLASNEILKRPTRMLHAEALRTGRTKVDEGAWMMRARIASSEARKAREEAALNGRLVEEPEPAGSPAP